MKQSCNILKACYDVSDQVHRDWSEDDKQRHFIKVINMNMIQLVEAFNLFLAVLFTVAYF